MKVCNKTLLIILMLFLTKSIFAQPEDYYWGKDKIYGEKYIYNLSINPFSKGLEVNNINNTKMESMYDSGGNPVPSFQLRTDPQYKFKLMELLKSVFKKEDVKKLIKENKPYIYFGFVVNDRTGKILEVKFEFTNITSLRNIIHPDKLYYLEEEIKK